MPLVFAVQLYVRCCSSCPGAAVNARGGETRPTQTPCPGCERPSSSTAIPHSSHVGNFATASPPPPAQTPFPSLEWPSSATARVRIMLCPPRRGGRVMSSLTDKGVQNVTIDIISPRLNRWTARKTSLIGGVVGRMPGVFACMKTRFQISITSGSFAFTSARASRPPIRSKWSSEQGPQGPTSPICCLFKRARGGQHGRGQAQVQHQDDETVDAKQQGGDVLLFMLDKHGVLSYYRAMMMMTTTTTENQKKIVSFTVIRTADIPPTGTLGVTS